MKTYGLIGYPLSHSWSQKFFLNKFKKEGIKAYYDLFPLRKIEELIPLLQNNKNICGLNVTIPYKELILPYVDMLSDEAAAVGAVNTLKVNSHKDAFYIKGFNTDVHGFSDSIRKYDLTPHQNALILGTGGAAKAVGYVLEKMGLDTVYASRTPKMKNQIPYFAIDASVMQRNTIVVNTTPLGMYPMVDSCPDIPYRYLTHTHLVYDLVYNPQKTLFLHKAEQQKAYICNGLNMLYAQAEKSWCIWNDDSL